MAYNVSRKVLNLVFEDGDYEGMEIRIKSLRTGEFLKVTRGASMMAGIGRDSDPALVRKAIDSVGDLFRIMGLALVSWNLADDDEPIPCVLAQCVTSGKPVVLQTWRCEDHGNSDEFPDCDMDGLMGQDMGMVIDIISAWVEAVGGIDAPLPKASGNGKSFPEVHIPMALLSESLQS